MRIFIFCLFSLVKLLIAQDTRSVFMTIVDDRQFQCANTTCLPFTTRTTSDVRDCQFVCLAEVQCQAVSFDQSVGRCELFADIISETGNMLTQIGTTTMLVRLETRMPPGEYEHDRLL